MTLSLLALAALGAFHGINPAMGWLFAVARGLQERSRRALLLSLPPIAAGHLASVGVVAALVTATRSVVATRWVAIGGGALLVGFGLWRALSRRHFRWAGMRLSLPELAGWSFLMSSAHGAGLMLLPVLATAPVPAAGHDGHAVAHVGGDALAGLVAAGLHTLAMFVVAGVVAVVVYQVAGLRILRTAWFNLDRLWAGVLITAGLLTIATA
ncbi:hypothetical protein [Catenuloplanes atrovinosus]|uniref:Uncharacterized protein n=1 Tax=Catenuloplanes atrovinosus TaxID=137266 RepID=A0AAE4C6U0_9ACTN|nr:hypothetical protein [Catenuloplanes atrovinosus]MDR7273881.1 hypothetical protein [Catenuloplanes atrovinosus]